MDFHTCFVCLPEGSSYTPPKTTQKVGPPAPHPQAFFLSSPGTCFFQAGQEQQRGIIGSRGSGKHDAELRLGIRQVESLQEAAASFGACFVICLGLCPKKRIPTETIHG